MAFTCKHLSQAELQALIDNGEFERIYNDSKASIESGNYVYDAESNMSDEDKLEYWKGVMQSFINGAIDKESYTSYCLAGYKDNVLCMLSATYFDTEDTSYNYTHALIGEIDGSKSYAFSTDFFTPQSVFMKSLGADKMVFYSVKGGSLSFRAITAQGSPSLFDYDRINQSEHVEEYEVEVPIVAEPTIDGSTKINDAVEKVKIARDEIKTVRYLK